MTGKLIHTSENNAAEAFNRQAAVFDSIYGKDSIIRYKRDRVREHTAAFLQPHSHILELNAGTGEDAVYFAEKGHRVHATDIATQMQEQLVEKVKNHRLGHLVTAECCSFTALNELQEKGPYDHIFSNFAGLNCTDKLHIVLQSLDPLLKPGGHVTLVVLPRFCIWELLLLFRGKFKTAFRRFTGKKGAQAHLEGTWFRCWYYNPSYIRKSLGQGYSMKKLEGLCTIVPPSYLENFAEKHPKLYQWLVRKENRLKAKWPWRSTGDYYIITLQKKPG